MKASIVRKPAERSKNDVKDQVIIKDPADSEATVNVTRALDGNYLIITDRKGVKLRVNLDQNCVMFPDNDPDMIQAKTSLYAFMQCNGCECIYYVFAGQRMCYNPNNGQICNC